MESEVFEREFFFESDFKDIQNEECKKSNEPWAMEDIMELEEEDELSDNFSKGLNIIGERLEGNASILRDKSGDESGKGDTEEVDNSHGEGANEFKRFEKEEEGEIFFEVWEFKDEEEEWG